MFGECGAAPERTLFALAFPHEEVLGVGRHVEAQREGEVCVDLLLHHGHHVESVSHGVEAQDARQLFETGSKEQKQKWRSEFNEFNQRL